MSLIGYNSILFISRYDVFKRGALAIKYKELNKAAIRYMSFTKCIFK